MKKLLLILALWPSFITAQGFSHSIYADFSVDPNKLTGLIDNPRTEVDHRGLDFDIEAGVEASRFGAYLFYGRFEAADYQNYGVGFDYYIIKGDRLDVASGVGISRIMRRITTGADWEREVWADVGGYASYHARIISNLWIFKNLGLSARFQYQRRGDIETGGILEGAVGVKYKFNRK